MNVLHLRAGLVPSVLLLKFYYIILYTIAVWCVSCVWKRKPPCATWWPLAVVSSFSPFWAIALWSLLSSRGHHCRHWMTQMLGLTWSATWGLETKYWTEIDKKGGMELISSSSDRKYFHMFNWAPALRLMTEETVRRKGILNVTESSYQEPMDDCEPCSFRC